MSASDSTAGTGAQVRIKLANQTITRQVEVGTGQGNQNEMTLHFGFGADVPENKMINGEILWPGGQRSQHECRVDTTQKIVRPKK